MKKLTFLTCIVISLIISSCHNQAYDKEVLIKVFDFSDKINFKIDTSKITETLKVVSYEGSFVKILAQTIQSDSIDAIKKISFYQSGSKSIQISNIQIGALFNKGTEVKPIMAVSGNLQFNKSTFLKSNIISKSFFLDGTGKMIIEVTEKEMKELTTIAKQISFGDVISNIEKSEEYKTAKNAPNENNTAIAMDFIINKSGLKDFFSSADVMTKKIVEDYLHNLFNTNKAYVENPVNKTSFQLQGHKLQETFKSLVIRGIIGSNPLGNNLKRLTELVKDITIPVV